MGTNRWKDLKLPADARGFYLQALHDCFPGFAKDWKPWDTCIDILRNPEAHILRATWLRDPYIIHLNITTCKWWFPFILVEKAMFHMVAKWRSFKKPGCLDTMSVACPVALPPLPWLIEPGFPVPFQSLYILNVTPARSNQDIYIYICQNHPKRRMRTVRSELGTR